MSLPDTVVTNSSINRYIRYQQQGACRMVAMIKKKHNSGSILDIKMHILTSTSSSRLSVISGRFLPSWEWSADDSNIHRRLQRLSVLPAESSQPPGLAEGPAGQQPRTQRRGVGAHLLEIQLR